jgi:CheY-like chemotaxis protein
MKMTKKMILLIDDDEVLNVMLTRVLTNAGYQVKVAQGVKHSLARLSQQAPDLIILDLNMPDLDGFDFLKFRRINQALGAIPVLVLSGLQDGELARRALEMGAVDFLQKPFQSKVILQKVRQLFLSDGELVYRFGVNEATSVAAEVGGELVECSASRLKIATQILFGIGKAVQIDSDDYLRSEGKTLSCRIENRRVEKQDGFYRTIVSPVGLDSAGKKHFELWLRTLCK